MKTFAYSSTGYLFYGCTSMRMNKKDWPRVYLGVANRADGANAVQDEEGQPARDKRSHDQSWNNISLVFFILNKSYFSINLWRQKP